MRIQGRRFPEIMDTHIVFLYPLIYEIIKNRQIQISLTVNLA